MFFFFRKGKEKEFPMAQNLSGGQKNYKMEKNYFPGL